MRQIAMLGAFLLALGVTAARGQEESREALFKGATEALDRARKVEAPLYSPRTFQEAERRLNEAEEAWRKGQDLAKIKERLAAAASRAEAAVKNTDLAKVTFSEMIPAREKAVVANAPSLAAKEWTRAEQTFQSAARALEDGKANEAKEKGSRARDEYASAELVAIKAAILGGAREAVAAAEAADADHLAPVTIGKAREGLAQVEAFLDRDRYAAEEARRRAAEVAYEARHALSIAQRARDLSASKATWEKVLLQWEDDIGMLGRGTGREASFDQGTAGPVAAAADAIAKLVSENGELSAELSRIQKEYRETQETQVTLEERLKLEQKRKERLARVSGLFSPAEATVLQDGEQIIIRLHGLTFPVGTATIRPEYFDLLARLGKALVEFPGASVAIGGHTDSTGDPRANDRLSLERAEAVRTYFIANLGMPAERVTARGYGDTRPVAPNTTEEGRAKNRRIDVVIAPSQ